MLFKLLSKLFIVFFLSTGYLFAQEAPQPNIPLEIYDEGVDKGPVDSIDCTGAGLACTVSGGRATFNGSGGGGGSTPGGSDTQVQFNDGGSTLGGNAGFVFIKSSGNVGIGSSLPNSLLNVLQGTNGYLKFASAPTSYTGNLTGNIYTNNLIKSSSVVETVKTTGLLVDHTDDQTVNNAVTQQGIEANVSVPTTNTFNNGSLQALVARASNLGTGTASSMFGLNGVITNAGGNVTTMRGYSSTLTNSGASNTVTTATGLYSVITNSGAGSTVTDFDGIRVLPSNSNATAQVTNFKGLNIADLTNTGTIANTHAVYVGDITTGTQTNTPFSFYASDAGANNYFAGNTGIGTFIPNKMFCVGTGCAASITSTGAITGSGTLTNSGTIYSDRTTTNSFALNSTGSNYGNIFNSSATSWALGSGSSQTVLGTPALAWTDSGNIGIGTTKPEDFRTGANKLVLKGTGDNGISIIAGTTNKGMIAFGRSEATADGGQSNRGKIWYDLNTEGMYLQTNAGLVTGTPGITINSANNVGVGTTVPGNLFQVASGANVFQVGSTGTIRFGGSSTSLSDTILSMNSSTTPVIRNNNNTAGSGLTYKGGGSASSYAAIQSTFGTGTTDSIRFLGGNDGATEFARFQNNSGTGNLGIGTTNPGTTLDLGAGNLRIGIGTTTEGTLLCVKSIANSRATVGYCTGTLTNSICGTCN